MNIENAESSVSGFFYNFIPGFLFILGTLYLFDWFPYLFFLFRKYEGLAILLLVVFGILMGFLFQGVAKFKFCRGKFDKESWSMVKKDNEKDNFPLYSTAYGELKRIIFGNNHRKKPVKIEPKKFFYLMYNYLRGKGYSETIMFFTNRSSLWSNFYFGGWLFFYLCLLFIGKSLINGTLFLDFYKIMNLSIIVPIIILFSRHMMVEHVRIFNETTLLTYISVIKHSKKFNHSNE